MARDFDHASAHWPGRAFAQALLPLTIPVIPVGRAAASKDSSRPSNTCPSPRNGSAHSPTPARSATGSAPPTTTNTATLGSVSALTPRLGPLRDRHRGPARRPWTALTPSGSAAALTHPACPSRRGSRGWARRSVPRGDRGVRARLHGTRQRIHGARHCGRAQRSRRVTVHCRTARDGPRPAGTTLYSRGQTPGLGLRPEGVVGGLVLVDEPGLVQLPAREFEDDDL